MRPRDRGVAHGDNARRFRRRCDTAPRIGEGGAGRDLPPGEPRPPARRRDLRPAGGARLPAGTPTLRRMAAEDRRRSTRRRLAREVLQGASPSAEELWEGNTYEDHNARRALSEGPTRPAIDGALMETYARYFARQGWTGLQETSRRG